MWGEKTHPQPAGPTSAGISQGIFQLVTSLSQCGAPDYLLSQELHLLGVKGWGAGFALRLVIMNFLKLGIKCVQHNIRNLDDWDCVMALAV